MKKLISIALLASFLVQPGWAASNSNKLNYQKLGQEIVKIVSEHFYDPIKAKKWAKNHKNYAIEIENEKEFSKRTNYTLSELETSHTHHYSLRNPKYYMLLSIFQNTLKIDDVEYSSIGADIAELPQGYFVASIFAGGPAEKAGLKRGDRITRADGKPFDPYHSLKDKSDKLVTLTVQRTERGPSINISVTPRRINPKKEWVEAQRNSSIIIKKGEKKIAYSNLWSCAGEEHQEALQDAIYDSFQDASALILDFRNGWGGCNPEFLNLFNSHLPALTIIDRRKGTRQTVDGQWRKPLYVLINEGTRSGKELVVSAIKKHKIGTLVGKKTAGAVVAGKPFLLSDKSLLYIAVKDILVDGTRLEGVGVKPDNVVSDRLPYADGADPQMEKALELAVNGIGANN